MSTFCNCPELEDWWTVVQELHLQCTQNQFLMRTRRSNLLPVIFAACGARLSVKPAILQRKPLLGSVPFATEITSSVGNVSTTTAPGRLQLLKGHPSMQENNSHFRQMTWTVVAFLMLLGTPLSWKKARMGTQIIWIGWIFDLHHYTVQLVDTKIERILILIQDALEAHQVSAKTMEQLL